MIRPFGEAALLAEVGSSARAQAVAATLRADPIPGVVEVVAGLVSLLVELDPLAIDVGRVAAALEERVQQINDAVPVGRARTIPVVYGGEHGPDLADVATVCGLSEAGVIERHAAADLRVLFLGFAPGFAYLGELPEALRLSRLATPRAHTPAGSVAIAGAMSGIYPADLPGGWRVIGRTPVVLFDPHRDPPAYLAPGDAVRFEPISPDEWKARAGPPADWR